jgi:hypothetical protein
MIAINHKGILEPDMYDYHILKRKYKFLNTLN